MQAATVRSTTQRSPPRAEGPTRLITHRAAAHACRVSPGMVLRWIETGAWPLPRAVQGMRLYFRLSDVSLWVLTGTWPTGCRFCRGDGAKER